MDILSALMALTASLRERGLVDNGAYARGSVGADLVLTEDGSLVAVERRRRTELLPRHPQRTSGPPVAALLSGTVDYWVTPAKRAVMKALHDDVLGHIDHPAVRAVSAFLAAPPPELPDIPGYLVPRVAGCYPHQIDDVVAAWTAAYRPPEGNPVIKIGAEVLKLVSLSSSPASASKSYGHDTVDLPPGVTSDYGVGLQWLIDQPACYYCDGDAIVSWLDSDPTISPTDYLMRGGEVSDWSGNAYILMLSPVPPARISVRLALDVSAPALAKRLAAFRGDLVTAGASNLTPWVNAYGMATRPNFRRRQVVAAIIQSLVVGAPLPLAAITEIVRLMRSDPGSINERGRMLEVAFRSRESP